VRALALGIFALFTVAGSFTEAQQTYRAENAQEHPAPHQWAREQSLIKFAAIADAVQPRSAKESDNDPQHEEHWWDKAWRHWVRRFFADAKITDAVVAIATAFLAIFTYRLWVSTDHMWEATKRSANFAEKSLFQLEAPYVYVEIINTGVNVIQRQLTRENGAVINLDPEIEYGNIKFCFANHGRTPAEIASYFDAVVIAEGADGIPDPIDPKATADHPLPPGIFAPKEGRTREYEIQGSEVLATIMNVVSRGRDTNFVLDRLFLIGFVRYADIFNNRYVTGFCYKFIRGENVFRLARRNGYNYRRREDDAAAQGASDETPT